MNSSLPAFRNPRTGLTENFKHRPRPPTALTENFKRCPRLRQHLRKILSIVRGLRQYLRKILSTVVGRRRCLQKILSTIVGRQSIFFILISSFLILKFPANSPQAGNCARNRIASGCEGRNRASNTSSSPRCGSALPYLSRR